MGDPKVAVAMKHFGPALDVVVEFDVELVVLGTEVVVLDVTDEPEICTETEVLWVKGPLVPVTLSVYVPTLDPCAAATESVEVPAAFEGGVTGLGRLNVTPVGAVPSHETVRPTAELNPACERMVMTEVPEFP
jgi:hypothetical protein